MDKQQLNSQLDKHLKEVISSRKVSLNDTKHIALNLWSLICTTQKESCSPHIVVQHYPDGKIITTMYTNKNTDFPSSSQLTTIVDDKPLDYWDDPELLPMLSIIAGNSDVHGKCRLYNKQICRELSLEFK